MKHTIETDNIEKLCKIIVEITDKWTNSVDHVDMAEIVLALNQAIGILMLRNTKGSLGEN